MTPMASILAGYLHPPRPQHNSLNQQVRGECALLLLGKILARSRGVALSELFGWSQPTNPACCLGKTWVEFIAQCANVNVPYFLGWFAICFVFWALLPFAVRKFLTSSGILSLFPVTDRKAAVVKCASSIHATVSGALAFGMMLSFPEMWGNIPWWWHPLCEPVLMSSVGYFVADIVHTKTANDAASPQARQPLAPIVIHHLACAVGIVYSVVWRIGYPLNLALLSTEVTTPLLHTRWALISSGHARSALFVAATVALWAGFLVFRVASCALQAWYVWHARGQYWGVYPAHVPVPASAIGVLLALNLHWFVALSRATAKCLATYFGRNAGKRHA